jgi:hypothetical protein
LEPGPAYIRRGAKDRRQHREAVGVDARSLSTEYASPALKFNLACRVPAKAMRLSSSRRKRRLQELDDGLD